jgi:hypothetical protein
VTVRRLTRTIRSIVGTSMIRPGPLVGISRPRRKTTPRSYSLNTRTEAAAAVTPIVSTTPITTISTTIATLMPPAPSSRPCARIA